MGPLWSPQVTLDSHRGVTHPTVTFALEACRSVEKLSSTKPISGSKTARNLWPQGLESCSWQGLSQGVSSTDEPSRRVILEAFAEFERFTCIRFVTYQGQRDFISIIPMAG